MIGRGNAACQVSYGYVHIEKILVFLCSTQICFILSEQKQNRIQITFQLICISLEWIQCGFPPFAGQQVMSGVVTLNSMTTRSHKPSLCDTWWQGGTCSVCCRCCRWRMPWLLCAWKTSMANTSFIHGKPMQVCIVTMALLKNWMQEQKTWEIVFSPKK